MQEKFLVLFSKVSVRNTLATPVRLLLFVSHSPLWMFVRHLDEAVVN